MHFHIHSMPMDLWCVSVSVSVSVDILSPSLSFIVQITYECYEVLKLKSLDNMVTFGKCSECIWKGFVRCERKTRCQENSLLEFFYDAIRGGRKKLPIWWRLTKDRLLRGKETNPCKFPLACRVENMRTTGMREKKLNCELVCTNLNFIAMKFDVRWTFKRMKWKQVFDIYTRSRFHRGSWNTIEFMGFLVGSFQRGRLMWPFFIAEISACANKWHFYWNFPGFFGTMNASVMFKKNVARMWLAMEPKMVSHNSTPANPMQCT